MIAESLVLNIYTQKTQFETRSVDIKNNFLYNFLSTAFYSYQKHSFDTIIQLIVLELG